MATKRQYSRLERIRQQKNAKSLVKYAILSIGLIALLSFFGTKLIGYIANVASNQRQGHINHSGDDSTPPPPPNVDIQAEYTTEDSLTIAGVTEPEATVTVYVNNLATETTASADGSFSVTVDIVTGDNSIYLTATDQAGNTSGQTKNYLVVKDKDDPDLVVTEPTDNQTIRGEQNKMTTIKGTTEAGTTVTVNDRLAQVGANGEWRLLYTLADGENVLSVKAKDKAGNESEIVLTVRYER